MNSTLNKVIRRLRRWKLRASYVSVLRSSSMVDGVVIVTGADSTHYKSLKQCIQSIITHEAGTRLVVMDLGLSQGQRDELRAAFGELDVRRFRYEDYPDWLDIRRNAGQYAWKPVIVAELMEESGCSVVWMDAGNLLLSRIDGIRRILAHIGFYSPYSFRNVAYWTHRGMIDHLKLPRWILGRQNLNGAFVAVNPAFPKARSLILKWREMALVKDCIAPAGSDRSNHRQDQSLLTVLAYQAGLGEKVYPEFLGFDVQRDVD